MTPAALATICLGAFAGCGGDANPPPPPVNITVNAVNPTESAKKASANVNSGPSSNAAADSTLTGPK